MLTILILLPLFGILFLMFYSLLAKFNLASTNLTHTEEPLHDTKTDLTLSLSQSAFDATENEGMYNTGYDLKVRQIALFTSILTFLFSTVIWCLFDFNDLGFQFIGYWPTIAGLGGAKIGIDAFGLIFIILTTYLMPVAILSTWDQIQHGILSHLVCLLFIEALLIAVFISLDLIAFYVTFEAVLIPLYILVGTHGATDSRIKASMLLFLYTLGGSLCMLLGLIRLIELKGSSDIGICALTPLSASQDVQQWIWLSIFISLSIKAPLVPVHIWLKTVHSEAPLSTSIVLAGLILKLSTYGYIRILLYLLPDQCVYFSPLVLTLSAITVIHGALVTLRQVDTKAFVAMSSVSHMGIVMLGLSSGTVHGIEGSMLMSVAHGLSSPALFILVGGVMYDRYHTRIIRYFKGLGSFMPSFKLWFFLATCASMGVPGSLNWISELLCLAGGFEVSPIAGILGATTIFFGAVYSIWFYMNITGGQVSPNLSLTPDMTRRERAMLMYLLWPIAFLGIFPSYLLTPLHFSVSAFLL